MSATTQDSCPVLAERRLSLGSPLASPLHDPRRPVDEQCQDRSPCRKPDGVATCFIMRDPALISVSR